MTIDGGGNPPYGLSDGAVRLYLGLAEGDSPKEPPADLQELIDAGLVGYDDAMRQIHLVDPELATAELQERHLSAVVALLNDAVGLLHIRNQLPYLRNTVIDSQGRVRPSVSYSSIRHLDDKATINALSTRLAATAAEVRSSKPGGPQSSATLAESRDRDLPHLRTHPGMVWRTLYASEARADPATCEWAADFTAAGAEVRTTTRPFARIMIFGRTDVLVSNPLIPNNGGAIHISDPATVAALIHDWDIRYAHCRPFTGPDPVGGIQLSEEQHSLIHALLEGRPRKAIANTLGIDPKTLSRRVAAIEQILGVTGDAAIGYAYAQWEDRQRRERGTPI